MSKDGRSGTACSHRQYDPERTVLRDAHGWLAGESPWNRTRVRVTATDTWTAKTGLSFGPRGVEHTPSRTRANLFEHWR
jgi:hypothetical protein